MLKESTLKLALALLFTLALPLSAQLGGGTIRGSVTDPTGRAVTGATVAILNTETGVPFKTQSDLDAWRLQRNRRSARLQEDAAKRHHAGLGPDGHG